MLPAEGFSGKSLEMKGFVQVTLGKMPETKPLLGINVNVCIYYSSVVLQKAKTLLHFISAHNKISIYFSLQVNNVSLPGFI